MRKQHGKRLKNIFQPDSRAWIVGLLDNFFNCKMGENKDVGLYAGRLSKIIKQLSGKCHTISEVYKAFQLILYLPQPYLEIVQSIYSWKN